MAAVAHLPAFVEPLPPITIQQEYQRLELEFAATNQMLRNAGDRPDYRKLIRNK